MLNNKLFQHRYTEIINQCHRHKNWEMKFENIKEEKLNNKFQLI